MSLYQDEYGFEKNPSPVSPTMTEIVGGALDAYYSRIHHMQQEIDSLGSEKRSAESRLESAESRVEETLVSRNEQAKRADNAEGKARVLQTHLDAKATEIAKRDKAIEQYAAWRVAVREALKDRVEDTHGAGNGEQILERIDDLTKAIEGES